MTFVPLKSKYTIYHSDVKEMELQSSKVPRHLSQWPVYLTVNEYHPNSGNKMLVVVIIYCTFNKFLL